MEVLNVGPFELLLIVILALLLLGPKGMVGFMQQAGSWIRKIVRSPIWKDILSTSKEIRELPQKIVREADLEAEFKEFQAWRAQANNLQANLNHEMQSIGKEISIQPEELSVKIAGDEPVITEKKSQLP
jgi:Sec-independent protein translocase protein TatA